MLDVRILQLCSAVADLKRGGRVGCKCKALIIINLQSDSLARYLTQSKSQTHRGPKIFAKSVINCSLYHID